MAKYNIVSTSKFNPFTYEELVRPLQEATQTHIAIEDQLGDYSSKVSMLDSMINPETEHESYTKYQNYMKNLDSQIEALSREGLNKVNRQGLQRAKKEYMQNIAPIEQAFTRRRQLVEEQRRLKSDPTLFLDKEASMMSLDDLVNSPELSYNTLSGAAIEKQTSALASNLAKQLRSDPNKWDEILETTIGNKSAAQYYRNLQQQGYTIDEILSLDDNALTTIVDQVLQGSSFYQNADPATKAQIESYAERGLWSALGTTKNETLANRAFEEQIKPDEVTPPDLPPEHHFSEINTTFIDPSKNTEKIAANRKFVESLLENPELLDKEEVINIPTSRMGGVVFEGSSHIIKPNKDKIATILQSLGVQNASITAKDGKFTDETKELLSNTINKLNSDIKKSAFRSKSYTLNVVDSENLNDILLRNAAVQHYQNKNSTAFTHIKPNGNRGEVATPNEVQPFLNENTAFIYDPMHKRFVIIGYNDSGDFKTFMVDPETITSNTVTLRDNKGNTITKNALQHAMDTIEERIEKEDFEGAQSLRTGMLNDIYYGSQSRSKVQTNTNSKL